MLIAYQNKRFNSDTLWKIERANEIIREYELAGYSLTLRQLYYQMVSRNLIPNTTSEYRKLGDAIKNARLAGLVSWTAIEDRTRNLRANPHWNSPSDALNHLSYYYRIDKWEGQPNRVEVWIEKDALIGVIKDTCSVNDVSYISCRGFPSVTVVWEASRRMKKTGRKNNYIIHLTDHDPSGIEMTKDLQTRFDIFLPHQVFIDRIALTMEQIEEYDPPPNPAKITDSRYKNYAKQYGGQSWELDALDPKVINQIVEERILYYRDDELWVDAVVEERSHIEQLRKFADKIGDRYGNNQNG